MKKLIVLVALFLCLATMQVQAQQPMTYMPFQGFVSDLSGNPINGAVTLTFKFYANQNDAQALWTETLANVPVQFGAFSVQLGEQNPSLKDALNEGFAKYIGISVNQGAEMLPRQKVGAVPYAFLSNNTLSLGGKPYTEFLTQDALVTEIPQIVNQTVQQNIQNINQGLTEAQVNQLIDSRAYVTQNEVQNLVVQQVQQINPGAGLTEAQVNQLIDAKTATFTTLPIVQTWVNGQNFLSQNQMIAWVNSQSYTTLPAVQTWVLDQDYVNATDVQNMINTSIQNAGGGGGLDTNAVNALIDARGYLTQNAIQALINASVAVVQNALNALTLTVNQHTNQIQTINANLVTLSDKDTFLQTKINDLTVQYNDLNAKYTTLNDQHLALQANFNAQQATITQLNNQLTALSAQFTTLNTQFTTLNTQVTTLNTQVTTLNTQVTTLSNQTTAPAVPEIVGLSGATNGRISVNGKNGIQGATELCKAAFANSHACSISEAHSAISANKYPANIVGTQTWISDPTLEVANHFSAANAFTGTKFCQSLQYNSGDVATGTTMQIRSYTSGGGGGGLAGFHLAFSNAGCGSAFSIMCCK